MHFWIIGDGRGITFRVIFHPDGLVKSTSLKNGPCFTVNIPRFELVYFFWVGTIGVLNELKGRSNTISGGDGDCWSAGAGNYGFVGVEWSTDGQRDGTGRRIST
jgi:hypothetical protein